MLELLCVSKNEGGNNLSVMIITLTSIVSCEKLKLLTPFVNKCWGIPCLNVVAFKK
jgi:hypothetical protein